MIIESPIFNDLLNNVTFEKQTKNKQIMRKLQLIVLAIILTTPTLNAFAGDDEGGKKGIRAGYQMSNFYDSGDSEGDNLHSFYAGVFGEKKLIPFLRFGFGLEYNSVGTNDKNFDDTRYTRHSLAIPLYAKVKLGPVFALGGAAPGFGISNKATLLGEDIDLQDEDKTSAFDAPVFLGLGFQIAIISIEARYHWGTMNLSKADNVNRSQQYFQVGAAVSF